MRSPKRPRERSGTCAIDQSEPGSASTTLRSGALRSETGASLPPPAYNMDIARGASCADESPLAGGAGAGDAGAGPVNRDTVVTSASETDVPATDLALEAAQEAEASCVLDPSAEDRSAVEDAVNPVVPAASAPGATDSTNADVQCGKRFRLSADARWPWVVACGNKQALSSTCDPFHAFLVRQDEMQECASHKDAFSVNELEVASRTACVSGNVPGRIFPQLDVFAAHQCAVELPLQRGVRREALAAKSHPPGFEVGTCEEVSCLHIPEGVLGDTVDSLLRRGFMGVRRLTLTATNAEGLLGIAGLESLVHLQLKFCGPCVISLLPDILMTLPGLRRLALVGCRNLDEKFFSKLPTCGSLLETLEIETHKSPSEPLCEGATKWLSKMPFLSTLRLLGEVRAFFDNTHYFRTWLGQEDDQAQLMCLDVTATEILYSGLQANHIRASTARLADSLSHLNSLRYLRLDGIYPNYVPALGTLGLLQVVDIAITFNAQDCLGFSLFHESERQVRSSRLPPSASELDEWIVGTCDTLRLHSPTIFTKQLADIRQGFARLRCLDIAWDNCIKTNGGQDEGSRSLARIICNFQYLEVLRVSPCARESTSSALLLSFDFLSWLSASPRLRELHVDTLDLSSATIVTGNVNVPPAWSVEMSGYMLGESLRRLKNLSQFSVARPIANGSVVTQEDWSYIVQAISHILNSPATLSIEMTNTLRSRACSESCGVSMEDKTTNIFSDWFTLFRRGGVPNF